MAVTVVVVVVAVAVADGEDSGGAAAASLELQRGDDDVKTGLRQLIHMGKLESSTHGFS